jgi:hypothetical protein
MIPIIFNLMPSMKQMLAVISQDCTLIYYEFSKIVNNTNTFALRRAFLIVSFIAFW